MPAYCRYLKDQKIVLKFLHYDFIFVNPEARNFTHILNAKSLVIPAKAGIQ